MLFESALLTGSAASLALVHTVLGPDHYLPFIAMAKAGNWSTRKSICITLLCGIGHVSSAFLLGLIGLGAGLTLHKFVGLDSWRGNLAGWALIAFGLVYGLWGLKKALRQKTHSHAHSHADSGLHTHTHNHQHMHSHAHAKEGNSQMTPWILFTIFIFGPCEPLIPLLLYPSVKNHWQTTVAVTFVFAFVTLITMVTMVLISLHGLSFLPMQKFERYSQALAGFTICLCGLGIQFLGL